IQCPDAPKDFLEMKKYGNALAQEITNHINHHPISIAFENIYSRFILFKKKMYIAVKVDNKGELDFKNIVYKGVAPARREHSEWVLNIYKSVINLFIVDRRPLEEIMDIIDDNILKLIHRQVPREKLIFRKNVGAYSNDSD